MARPARRWKKDCRTRQPTTARRCSTACSRTSQPLRTENDRGPAAWPSDGVPAQAERDAEDRQHRARRRAPTTSRPRPRTRHPATVTSSPAATARTIRRRRAAGGCGPADRGRRPAGGRAARPPARGPSGRSWPRRAASPSPVTSALTRAAFTHRMPSPSETVQPRIRSISSSVCRRVISPRTRSASRRGAPAGSPS